jgi:hypothetical protein
VYYLGDNPVQLTAADSGLTLRSYAGERAELSGGEPLTGLSWTRVNVTHLTGRTNATGLAYSNGSIPIWAAPLRSVGQLTAVRLRSTGRRVQRARHPNADPETIGARRSGNVNEGWMGAAGPDWFAAPAGPTPGQDFVSTGADYTLHYAHTLYPYTMLIHCTHTLYSYTVLIHCTHTPYSYRCRLAWR